MYKCAPCIFLMPMEVRRACQVLLELELKMVVRHPVGARAMSLQPVIIFSLYYMSSMWVVLAGTFIYQVHAVATGQKKMSDPWSSS